MTACETDPDELDDGAAKLGKGRGSGRGKAALDRDATEDGPSRRCIATRETRPQSQMIRFVRAPDGTVTPDLKAVLPGRGAWVTARRADVEAARVRKAFARAFKTDAVAPDDLAARVETLLTARAVEGLSLANKAGAVVAGRGKVEDAARKGHILGLLHAAEASPGEAGKLDALARAVAEAYGSELTISSVMGTDEMGLALGRMHVIHACLDGGADHAPVSRMALARIARLAAYRGDEV